MEFPVVTACQKEELMYTKTTVVRARRSLVGLVVMFSFVLAAPVAAQADARPTVETGYRAAAAHSATDVFSSLFSSQGDTPIRYGKAAEYGKVHIEKDHSANINSAGGWDPYILDIEHTLEDGAQKSASGGKYTFQVKGGLHQSKYAYMRVVFTFNNKGMPDGRPKGIITAFYASKSL
jgi:hypothetical protein